MDAIRGSNWFVFLIKEEEKEEEEKQRRVGVVVAKNKNTIYFKQEQR